MLIRKCVDENAHISARPKVYAEKYEQLADRYAKAKDKLDKTETEIANRNSRKNMIAAFLDEVVTCINKNPTEKSKRSFIACTLLPKNA